MKYKNIYLIGNGRIADDCLRILAEHKIQVSYIQAEEEKFSFTEKLCERLGIQFFHAEQLQVQKLLMEIKEDTLILSVHNSYIFPKDVVVKENLTILNMHIAPLPMYRGMNAPTWEIYEQQDTAGVTWHEVAEGIDEGRIIYQKTFPIETDDTAMKVLQKSFQMGVQLFKEHIDDILEKKYVVWKSKKEKTKLYLGQELPNCGYIDVSWDFDKCYAFLRSMDYKGANIMPLPRIIGNDNVYEIISYKKQVTDETIMRMPPAVNISDTKLNIEWGGYSLNCELRRVVD